MPPRNWSVWPVHFGPNPANANSLPNKCLFGQRYFCRQTALAAFTPQTRNVASFRGDITQDSESTFRFLSVYPRLRRPGAADGVRARARTGPNQLCDTRASFAATYLDAVNVPAGLHRLYRSLYDAAVDRARPAVAGPHSWLLINCVGHPWIAATVRAHDRSERAEAPTAALRASRGAIGDPSGHAQAINSGLAVPDAPIRRSPCAGLGSRPAAHARRHHRVLQHGARDTAHRRREERSARVPVRPLSRGLQSGVRGVHSTCRGL
jgi:hypothetical protein